MKIYTRTGDDGTTGLFAGGRVAKSHQRIETYGTVDELNSVIGLARGQLEAVSDDVGAALTSIQEQLFTLGADLATLSTDSDRVNRVNAGMVASLESAIDRFEDELPPLTSFILPGGSPAAATLHLARTTCRRAERLAVRLSENESITGSIIAYLNRLSDLLFVLARVVNQQLGIPEHQWRPS